MKLMLRTDMISHGTHQLALRRMSVKVLLGATKVLMRRAPSLSGGSGVTAAGVDMSPPVWKRWPNSSKEYVGSTEKDAARSESVGGLRGRAFLSGAEQRP